MPIESVSFFLSDHTVQIMDLKQRSFDKSILFSLSIQETKQLLEMDLIVLDAVKLSGIRIELAPMDYGSGEMLMNGFQSWTGSSMAEVADKPRRLAKAANLFKLNRMGDYDFYANPTRKNSQHAHEYTIINWDGQAHLLGSLNTDRFFTVIERCDGAISLYVDMEGISLKKGEELNVVKLLTLCGEIETRMIRDYMNRLPGVRKPGRSLTGWTSWYFYNNNITEEELLKQIEVLEKTGPDLDVFQIDDGYQKAIGDWLHTNGQFPGGMKMLADAARRAGFIPGIWLAPFICERKSFIFKEKKAWLLKDHKGEPVVAGWNPLWAGNFYALDFYNKEFQLYLRKVLRNIFRTWGYGMVKLDFLYAACLCPREGKTRAMVMQDALALIMEEAGSNLVLACGVPLASAFKKVDYCRIGPDAAPYWEDERLKFMGYRERTSTVASLRNTLNRAHLNNIAFGNDPDVFMLRSNDIQLGDEERHTLFVVSHLLGSMVFFSDDIRMYNKQELALLKMAYPKKMPEDVVITQKDRLYKLRCTIEGQRYQVYVNLSEREKNVVLPEGRFMSKHAGVLAGGTVINLEPHMTRCYLQINNQEEIKQSLGFPILK